MVVVDPGPTSRPAVGQGTASTSDRGAGENVNTEDASRRPNAKKKAQHKETPRLAKLVIRRLPPTLTSEAFHEALKSCPCPLRYVEYQPGSKHKAYMGYGRAYVTIDGVSAPAYLMPSPSSSASLAQRFKQWVEGGGNAGVFGDVVVVGFAACRSVPDAVKGQQQRVNELDGTLEGSQVFQDFLERFERMKEAQEAAAAKGPVCEPIEVGEGAARRTALMAWTEQMFRKKGRGKKKKHASKHAGESSGGGGGKRGSSSKGKDGAAGRGDEQKKQQQQKQQGSSGGGGGERGGAKKKNKKKKKAKESGTNGDVEPAGGSSSKNASRSLAKRGGTKKQKDAEVSVKSAGRDETPKANVKRAGGGGGGEKGLGTNAAKQPATAGKRVVKILNPNATAFGQSS